MHRLQVQISCHGVASQHRFHIAPRKACLCHRLQRRLLAPRLTPQASCRLARTASSNSSVSMHDQRRNQNGSERA
jgi:hypothetical protein